MGSLANGYININTADLLVFNVLGTICTTGVMTDGNYRIACVSDSVNTFLYVDGLLRDTQIVGLNIEDFSDDVLFVGGSITDNAEGNIKNFRIYDRALTPAEIAIS